MSYLEKLLQGQAVEWVTLGEVANIKTGQAISKSQILDNVGIYPVINSGREPLGYINTWNTENDPIGITTRGAGVGSVIWQEGKYFRGNLNYSVTVDSSTVLPRFLYHILLEFQAQIHNLCTFTGIPALNAKELKKLKIPLPPLTVQQRIAQILDTMTALTAELTAEHTLRQKQYQYYREKLLTFADETSGGGYKWVTLGEVCDLKRGKRLVKSELEIQGLYPVYQNSLTPLGYYDDFNCRADTTFIITAGAAGEIGYSNTDFWAADDCYMVNCPENLDSRFVYHALMTQKNIIAGQVRKASVPRLGKQSIEKLKIPLPPLATQQNIVAVLDTFDTLTQSISQGLPHAIALHQKRYEYYRGALLNFNE